MRSIVAMMLVSMLGACASNPTSSNDSGSVQLQSPIVVTPAAPVQQASPPAVTKAAILADLNGAAATARNNDDPDGFQCAEAGALWVGTLPFPEEAPQKPLILPDQRGLAIDAEVARLEAREARTKLKNAKARIGALRDAILAGPPRNVVVSCAVVVHDAKKDLLEVLGLAKLIAGL